MKVNIDEIQEVVSLLLKKLKKSKGNEIELNNDFYWDISTEELYNPYAEPANLSLGQLSDDLLELKRLSTSDNAIVYDLKRVASIIKALSVENEVAF